MSTHLGDLPSTDIGKALKGQSQDIGRPVDGEALAGWDLSLAPVRKGRTKALARVRRIAVLMLG